MKQISWSAYDGRDCVGVGTVSAKDERSALYAVLNGNPFPAKPERRYTVRAGGVTASARGSEFTRVAAAGGNDAWGDGDLNLKNAVAELTEMQEAAKALKALDGKYKSKLDVLIDGVQKPAMYDPGILSPRRQDRDYTEQLLWDAMTSSSQRPEERGRIVRAVMALIGFQAGDSVYEVRREMIQHMWYIEVRKASGAEIQHCIDDRFLVSL